MENINCLQCKFRHPDNGNCMEVGGFCTAVPAAYCPLLRQYLGTWMTPEQVVNAKTIIESAFADDTSKAERIRNLMAADDEGRVVVLPCEVGTATYYIHYPIAVYPDKSKPEIKRGIFTLYDLDRLGHSVFLTREEAEKALQEMEDKA